MRALYAFFKKELVEQVRSGRITILAILFVLFGIMNPAIAKLTPWLLETWSDSLAESGMVVTAVSVSAMDSWVQFFKNMPIALIAFILLQSSLFTKEYANGTLVLSLTKGLKRYKVVLSKAVMLVLLWTACYWLCFGITYAYNAYFWDNSVAQNLWFSVVCWWLFGMWVLSLMILCSTLANTNTSVLMGGGSVVLASYAFGLLSKVSKYFPTFLTDGNSLIYGYTEARDYTFAILVAVTTSVICFATSIFVFNKKQL